MTPHCCFCGRDEVRSIRSRLAPILAICIYCLRAGVRTLGEVPDTSDGVVEFVGHRVTSRRGCLLLVDEFRCYRPLVDES